MGNAAKGRNGLYPAPVYIVETGSGETFRLSFWSQRDKPIDFAAGARAVDELLLTDMDPANARLATRADGSQHLAWARRETVVTLEPRENEHAAGWLGMRASDHGRIVRRWVEHDSIGRVEDTPDNRATFGKPARRKAPAVVLMDDSVLRNLARALAHEFEGTPRADIVWQTVKAMRAELGLPATGG